MLSRTNSKTIIHNVRDYENIYYNVKTFNNGDNLSYSPDGKIPASYSEIRQSPLLPTGNNYKMAILKMSISFDQIPMFLVGEHSFSVGLAIPADGILITQQLFQTTSPNTAIVSNNQMIDMFQGVNQSYLTAFNNLVLAYDAIYGPGAYAGNILLPQAPPFIVYDEQSQLHSIYFPIEGSDSSNTVHVYMNYELSRLFIGILTSTSVFPSNSILTRISFIAKPQNLNVVTLSGIDYIVNTQIFTSTELWYDTGRLVISSSSFGIRAQEIGGVSSSQVNKQSFPIMVDYSVTTSNGPKDNPSTLLNYYPQAQYRWIDILSDQPISQIKIDFYILTKRGILRQLFLRPDDFLDITFVFSNKGF